MVHLIEFEAFQDIRQYEAFNRTPLLLAIRREFERLLERHSFEGKRVLEIGCGGNSFQQRYSGTRFIVLSDLNITLLQLNGTSAMKVVCDGEFVSFRDRTFHVIIFFGVLHHYVNQERGLKELKRLLAPGGQFL